MEALKRSLRERYIETYKECKKFKYFPRAFLDMVVSGEDIIDVTRRLIYKEGGTSGFATLFACKRMDLSVERIILSLNIGSCLPQRTCGPHMTGWRNTNMRIWRR